MSELNGREASVMCRVHERWSTWRLEHTFLLLLRPIVEPSQGRLLFDPKTSSPPPGIPTLGLGLGLLKDKYRRVS